MWSDSKYSKASREQEISRHLLSEVSHEERNEEWNMGNLWFQEPNIPRVAKGVKERVNRLKGLGNAIVPQIAYQIFTAIKEVEEHKED
jgi:DNA (cytosine-5)-methyltransferase 1